MAIKLNKLCVKIQTENFDQKSTDITAIHEAEQLIVRMLETVRRIYLPWQFDMFQRVADEILTKKELMKIMKPLEQNAPKLFTVLMAFEHKPKFMFINWWEFQTKTYIVYNLGKKPPFN